MSEPLLNQVGDVGTRPCRDAVSVGITQDQRPQHGLLTLCQFRTPPVRSVAQARQPLGIVAHHGVSQCLALHPTQPRRFCPRHAFKGIGNRESP